jgi:hypothetical protein
MRKQIKTVKTAAGRVVSTGTWATEPWPTDTSCSPQTTKTRFDSVDVPVNGHGITMKSGLAKVYSTPGLIGGSWINKKTGETFFRRNDERCIPIKVIIHDYDVDTGTIMVKGSWLREEEQADLCDYVAMCVRNKVGFIQNTDTVVALGAYPASGGIALHLEPSDPPTSGKAGDFFVWTGNNHLYYHDGISWCEVMLGMGSGIFFDHQK